MLTFSNKFRFLRLTSLLFLSFILNLPAQEITGSLEGRILDPDGHPLNEVNIIISGEDLQGTRGTISNSKGYFRILNLPPGSYDINLTHISFQDVIIEDITIALNKTTSVGDINLKERTLQTPDIIVYGQKPIIDPVSTTFGGNIAMEDFELLPVDRNYSDITALMPQANSSYFGDPVNIGGATGFENKYYIDGIDVSEPMAGTSGTRLPYNFIREVELNSGGYGPGSYSAMGGQINTITRSGSNQFHGSVYGFYSTNRFFENKRAGTLNNHRGDFSNYDIGFSMGGPVVYDKLWFYAAYNPIFNEKEVKVNGFGTFTDRSVTHAFAAKLNWRAMENLHVTLMSSGDLGENDQVNPGRVGYTFESMDSRLRNNLFGGVNYALSALYNISGDFFIKGSFAHVGTHNFSEGSTKKGRDELKYDDRVVGFVSGGVGSHWDSFRNRNTGRLSASFIFGNHTFNGGVEYRINAVDNFYENHSLLRRNGSYYIEFITREDVQIYNKRPSVFLQDNWRITDDLDINAGVRWETHAIVGQNGKVAQNVDVPLQPRLGLVYTFGSKKDQRIFASYGRFSQEFALSNSLANHSYKGLNYEIAYHHDPRINPAGGDSAGFVYIIQPEVKGLRGQYSDEFSLGYERIIGWNILAAVQGTYRTLGEAIEDIYIWGEDRRQFGNPGKGILSDLPKVRREYSALILSLERSNDPGFNFRASYVLSRAYGNYEGLYDAFNNRPFPNINVTFNSPSDIDAYYTGLLSQDRTHVFKFSGSYNFSGRFSSGISFVAQSGTPLSVYAGGDEGLLKFLEKRGSVGRTPAVWDLNARLVYNLDHIRPYNIKLILDALHIASVQRSVVIVQRKYLGVEDGVPVAENPNYGQTSTYQPAMYLRLGMEVSF